MDDVTGPDGAVEGFVGEGGGVLQEAGGEPVVVLDEAMVELLAWPGSSRPPGGWKWMELGAASRKERGSPAKRLGGTPKARLNAREKASTAS